jgi:hypothetical protein
MPRFLVARHEAMRRQVVDLEDRLARRAALSRSDEQHPDPPRPHLDETADLDLAVPPRRQRLVRRRARE